MAAPAVTFETIRQQISRRQLSPVYMLHGEEGYFIDELVKDFEGIIPPEDKEFNQYILYGPQTDPTTIANIAGGFPMMGERQVVIVKELQEVDANTLNALAPYVMRPSPTTVLVLVFRGEKAKGKDLVAAAKAKGVVYEAAKVRDYQMPKYIAQVIKDMGLSVDPKAAKMLTDYIGLDLSRLHNEIGKLATILGPGAMITPESVERNIGVSKDYNNFELVDALSVKDAPRCFRIVRYFASNPKANAVPVTIATLYNYYSDLLIAFFAPDKSDRALMHLFKLKAPVQLKRYTDGMRHYNAFQVIECIRALRQCDTRSKGNGSRQNMHDLLHDLVFRLITAPGNLGV